MAKDILFSEGSVSLFLLGLSFGAGPCIASCGPFLIAYIAGTHKNITQGLCAYFLFSFARVCAYVILGISVFFLGRIILERWLADLLPYLRLALGLFIVLLGALIIAGTSLKPKFCLRLEKNIVSCDKKSLFVSGFLTGLLPCAPLLAVFSYTGVVSRHWLNSLFYCVSFGLGTVVSPLILLVILAGLMPRYSMDKRYTVVFNFICGLIIIYLGLRLALAGF